MKYEFHRAALEEYREAALWYADRDQNVGSRFIACVENAIERIVESPQRWRVIDDDIRRCGSQAQ